MTLTKNVLLDRIEHTFFFHCSNLAVHSCFLISYPRIVYEIYDSKEIVQFKYQDAYHNHMMLILWPYMKHYSKAPQQFYE